MTSIWLEKSVGRHLIVNLYCIEDEDLLSYIKKGQEVLNDVINELNLHIVGRTGHQYDPYGYTIAYALSESHLTIHTCPDYKSAYLDIFCGNPDFDPNQALQILKEVFKTETSTHIIINR